MPPSDPETAWYNNISEVNFRGKSYAEDLIFVTVDKLLSQSYSSSPGYARQSQSQMRSARPSTKTHACRPLHVANMPVYSSGSGVKG